MNNFLQWLEQLNEANQKLLELTQKTTQQAFEQSLELTQQYANQQLNLFNQLSTSHSKTDEKNQSNQSNQTKSTLKDPRFKSALWQDGGFYEQQAKTYLTFCEHIEQQTQSLTQSLPKQQSMLIELLTNQWLDAIAPSNFLWSNPEALQASIDTQGESLKQGWQNYLQDLQKGYITQTDEQAFKVGQNLATTAGDIIVKQDLFELIRYHLPKDVSAKNKPLLIVPPCINKYYILDLQAQNSLVAYMANQGFNVYLMSWNNSQNSNDATTWQAYVDAVTQAMQFVYQDVNTPQIHTMGFCIGGTLLSCALAQQSKTSYAFKPASLTLLTTLLDFKESGILGALVNQPYHQMQEQVIGKGGLIKGRDLAVVFNQLRPQDLIWKYVNESYLQGKQPMAFDILYWNSDSSNLPGPMYCWYLKNTYLANELAKHYNLKAITCPVFALGCQEDHIVPWQGAFNSLALLGSCDKTYTLGASGHIAGVISSPNAKNASKRYYHQGHFMEDANAWLDNASKETGSWWPNWANWLAQHSTALDEAIEPNEANEVKTNSAKKTKSNKTSQASTQAMQVMQPTMPALYAAPGEYVLIKV